MEAKVPLTTLRPLDGTRVTCLAWLGYDSDSQYELDPLDFASLLGIIRPRPRSTSKSISSRYLDRSMAKNHRLASAQQIEDAVDLRE